MLRLHLRALAVTLMLTSMAFAKDHDFHNGRLLDVTTEETVGEGSAYSRVIFTVQVDDIVYTLKGERVRHSTKDYGEGLIVGDEVKAAIEGNYMVLLKPNSKDLKAAILKRERAAK
jgi:hypothetical protein